MYLRGAVRFMGRSPTPARAQWRSSAASVADATGGVLYADTSALVKLLVREAESEAVEAELARWPGIATSSIASIEIARALLRAREASRESVADAITTDDLVSALAEIPLTTRVRDVAGRLEPAGLRTLDAIHLASALELGDDLGALLTYDHRLADAARTRGIDISSPM